MDEILEPDEMFDGETTEEAPPPGTDFQAQVEYWQKRSQKAEKQAVERRVALRRYEAAAKHGVPADKIPDWVPADKLDQFASEFLKPSPAAETQEPEEPAQPEVEVPDSLVATTGPTAPGAEVVDIGARELGELMKTDPARATRLMQAKYGGSRVP